DWNFIYGNTGVYTFMIRAADINGNTTSKTIYVYIIKPKTPCVSTSSVQCGETPLPPVPTPTLPPVYNCGSTISTNLSYGLQNNNDVYKLQACLKERGYLSVSPNGNFGPKTLEAVKKLQSDNGLPSTGLVGPQTRNLIKDSKGKIFTATDSKDLSKFDLKSSEVLDAFKKMTEKSSSQFRQTPGGYPVVLITGGAYPLCFESNGNIHNAYLGFTWGVPYYFCNQPITQTMTFSDFFYWLVAVTIAH
ncbi:MAG: peptidoglycan-binding domain-containing protein, partial [Patescibacteria group bacterium]